MNFNLIKKDDLCWNESDQKYVPLSEDEIDKILESLYGDGITPVEVEVAIRAVRWAEKARLEHLFLQGVLSGRLRMYLPEDEEEEFIFYEDPSLPGEEQ